MIGAGVGRPRSTRGGSTATPRPSPGGAGPAGGGGTLGRVLAVAAVGLGLVLVRQLGVGAALDVQAIEQFAEAAQMGWRVQAAATPADCQPQRCFGASPPPGLTASAEGPADGPTLRIWDGERLVAEASFSREGGLRWAQRPGG